MKNKSAILRGVSTLAVAATFFAQGAKAETPVVVSSATTNSLSPAASQAGPSALGQKTDAIVTSAASASGVGDANISSLSVPATTSTGILSKFTARVDEVYYGASLAGLGDPNQPNDVQKDFGGAPVTLRSNVGVGYNISPDLMAGAVARVDYEPKQGNNYLWDDAYLRLMAPKLINKGQFTAIGDLRFYVPTARLSRLGGEMSGIMTRFVPSYNPTGSRWTFGTIFYHTWYVRDGRVNGVDASDMYGDNIWASEFYAGPNISYQLTPNVALTALYEFDAVRMANASGLLNYTSDTHTGNGFTDFEPGVNWSITPTIYVNPFLNMYPGSDFSLDTTNINVLFGMKLL